MRLKIAYDSIPLLIGDFVYLLCINTITRSLGRFLQKFGLAFGLFAVGCSFLPSLTFVITVSLLIVFLYSRHHDGFKLCLQNNRFHMRILGYGLRIEHDILQTPNSIGIGVSFILDSWYHNDLATFTCEHHINYYEH